MMRGRGGRPLNRGTQLRVPFKTVKTHVAKPPFDLTISESSFTRVNPMNDDNFQAVSMRIFEIVIHTHNFTSVALSTFRQSRCF